MNITEATREGDAESNKMVDRDEDYNTRYGGYAGYQLAFTRTKLIPRKPMSIDLVSMVQAARADTADKVVDHFIHRFMRVALADKDRAALVEILTERKLGTSRIERSEKIESALSELLYLVLSTAGVSVGVTHRSEACVLGLSRGRPETDDETRIRLRMLTAGLPCEGMTGIGVGGGTPARS